MSTYSSAFVKVLYRFILFTMTTVVRWKIDRVALFILVIIGSQKISVRKKPLIKMEIE